MGAATGGQLCHLLRQADSQRVRTSLGCDLLLGKMQQVIRGGIGSILLCLVKTHSTPRLDGCRDCNQCRSPKLPTIGQEIIQCTQEIYLYVIYEVEAELQVRGINVTQIHTHKIFSSFFLILKLVTNRMIGGT